MINTTSYVTALYELGVEKNSTKLYYEISRKLLELIDLNPKLINYLGDIQVILKEKKNLINEITQDKTFRKFLYVIIEGNKIRGLRVILQKFIKAVNNSKGIIEGVIYTINKLDVESVKKIEGTMSNKLEKNIHLSNVIDEEIIGGIKVELDGQVWDYSLRNQVNELAFELINKKGGK